MANSLTAANHNNQMISLINPFSNQQHHQLDDVNLFTGNCTKCRSCFVNLPECQDQACVAIDSSHRKTFLTLTGVELSSTPKSVDFLCLNCANMLKIFSEMGQAAAEMQNRYIEFMQNQIDIVKVEPEQSEDEESDSDDEPKIVFSDDEELEQIFQEIISLFENNNDVNADDEIETSDDAAVENMQKCSVQLTRLSSGKIKQYSTDKKTKISNEFKFPIDVCNKIFCKSKKNLYQHRYQVHQRDSQDESNCNQCGKVCKNRKALRNHQQMHNKKVSCKICDKSFTQKYFLIDHMDTYHIEGSKFDCTECSKTFKSQWKLKKHQRNIHDAKKFKCDQCNAAFVVPCHLTDHVKVKHEGKRFHCTYPGCSEKFNWKCDAAKHLRTVHKLEGDGDEYKKYRNQITVY